MTTPDQTTDERKVEQLLLTALQLFWDEADQDAPIRILGADTYQSRGIGPEAGIVLLGSHDEQIRYLLTISKEETDPAMITPADEGIQAARREAMIDYTRKAVAELSSHPAQALAAYDAARANGADEHAGFEAAIEATKAARAAEESASSDQATDNDDEIERRHEAAYDAYDRARSAGRSHPEAQDAANVAAQKAGSPQDEAETIAWAAASVWHDDPAHANEIDWPRYEEAINQPDADEPLPPDQVQIAYNAARAAGQKPAEARAAAYHYAVAYGADEELAEESSSAAQWHAEGKAHADNLDRLTAAYSAARTAYQQDRDAGTDPDTALARARQRLHDSL